MKKNKVDFRKLAEKMEELICSSIDKLPENLNPKQKNGGALAYADDNGQLKDLAHIQSVYPDMDSKYAASEISRLLEDYGTVSSQLISASDEEPRSGGIHVPEIGFFTFFGLPLPVAEAFILKALLKENIVDHKFVDQVVKKTNNQIYHLLNL